MSTAETVSGVDPAYLAAKEKLAAGKTAGRPLPRRQYGRTKEKLSIIGFGGMVVKDVTPKEAANFVAEAVDRGVNYFDAAPYYGNAQRRLGPALRPYRQKCFLACKTLERDAAGSARDSSGSRSSCFRPTTSDLYQLHALTDVEEVEQAFGRGGAMETLLKAKQDGTVRDPGFSAQRGSGRCCVGSLRLRLDPVSSEFPHLDQGWLWSVSLQTGEESGHGHPGSEGDAHQRWPKGKKQHHWTKTFYEPFDEIDQAALGLRFTLHLPVTALFPPGHWELFQMALALAQAGALTPLSAKERKIIKEIAEGSEPIFP